MKKQIKLILKRTPSIKKNLKYLTEKIVSKNFERHVKNEPAVFIYQMGKVASSSTYQSLKKQYSGACIQSHSFTRNNDNIHVKFLFEILQREKLPLKIISMVREPISRNISAFFQNFERDTGVKHKANQHSVEELKDIFLRNYNHEIPLIWLDENINKNFGIDVYKSPFPEKGYDIFKNREVELLLFKHNLEDRIKEEILGDFIGITNFKLTSANVGEEKEYASTYKKFCELNLPEYYLDQMLNSKYATHFYNKKLKEIRKRWVEKSH
jgi:hypothetical protein